ncbi:MAG TPA: calcium-binding protein [Allosphingosinicella sp.]|nr:calcium-binding protein [Allosphingosinicella sp.]
MADITGTENGEFLGGTPGDDNIDGLGGDDAIQAGAGNDVAHGGDGDDFINGFTGDDSLYGDADDDYLRGGAGINYIDGGTGYDRAAYVTAPSGVTVDLRLQGAAQSTGWGTDTLVNIEHLSGTIYTDTFYGDDNDNWLWALGPTDGVTATNDNLYGNGGNDLLQAGTGNHILDGGAGMDAIGFGQPGDVLFATPDPLNGYGGGIVIDLFFQGVAQDTRQGMMTLIGIENVSGSVLDDLVGLDNAAYI